MKKDWNARAASSEKVKIIFSTNWKGCRKIIRCRFLRKSFELENNTILAKLRPKWKDLNCKVAKFKRGPRATLGANFCEIFCWKIACTFSDCAQLHSFADFTKKKCDENCKVFFVDQMITVTNVSYVLSIYFKTATSKAVLKNESSIHNELFSWNVT